MSFVLCKKQIFTCQHTIAIAVAKSKLVYLYHFFIEIIDILKVLEDFSKKVNRIPLKLVLTGYE